MTDHKHLWDTTGRCACGLDANRLAQELPHWKRAAWVALSAAGWLTIVITWINYS